MHEPQPVEPRPVGLVGRLRGKEWCHIRTNGLEPGAILPTKADFASRAGDRVLSLMIDHALQTKQILDVRRTIELRTVALGALRRSDREAAEIVALAARMRAKVEQAETVIETDVACHAAIRAMRAAEAAVKTLIDAGVI